MVIEAPSPWRTISMLENATIVVGTDLTETSAAAVEAAGAIAARFGAERLVLVHGVKSGGPFIHLGDGAKIAVDRAKERLSALSVDAGAARVERVVRSGPPARVFAEVAEETGAELIVVASHGFGAIRRAFMGSVANATVRASGCPVLVVAPERDGRGPVERITAAVDLSPVSDKVVRSAVTFGCAYRAPVRLLSVCEHPGLILDDLGENDRSVDPREVEAVRVQHRAGLETLAEQGRSIDVAMHTHVVEGETPADAILRDIAESPPSLLVIGTSGHDGWHRLVLGATADQVMCEARCPVLVVPADAPALEGCRSVVDG